MKAKVVEITKHGQASLKTDEAIPTYFEKSAIGLSVGEEVELVEHRGFFVIKSSPERLEALAEKMLSDLVTEHGEYVETVSLKELLIDLLCAENDVDELPLDFYAVARWLVKNYKIA